MQRFLLIPLLVMVPAVRGEFKQIEQSLTGLECVSCAESVRAAMQRNRSVESAELTTDAFVKIRLKPDNRVRLENIRDTVKGSGFTPREARVIVRGRAVQNEGKWQFRIEGLDQTYRIEADARLEPELRRNAGELVTAEGVVPAQATPRDEPVLQLRSVAREP